jgi:hypothetical protein
MVLKLELNTHPMLMSVVVVENQRGMLDQMVIDLILIE